MDKTKLTLKLKVGGKFILQPMPNTKSISATMLAEWEGKPCVAEFVDGDRKWYAYGNDEVRGPWEEGKIVMDMEAFQLFWKFKLLEYGMDLFTRLENREERIAIMTTEGATEQEAKEYCDSLPHIYDIDDF